MEGRGTPGLAQARGQEGLPVSFTGTCPGLPVFTAAAPRTCTLSMEPRPDSP